MGGKGPRQQRNRGLLEVIEIGHAIWLMFLAASDAVAAANHGGSDANLDSSKINASAATPSQGSLVLKRVRAMMLACSLLKQSDRLRPEFLDAMKRPNTAPSKMWRLLSSALEPSGSKHRARAGGTGQVARGKRRRTRRGGSEASGCGEQQLAGDTAAGIDNADKIMHSADLGSSTDAQVSIAMTRLLDWSRPELIFKFLDLHAGNHKIHSLASRWARSILQLSDESLHELRCMAEPNAQHFARLAASGESARHAIERWIAADRVDCWPPSPAESTFETDLGVASLASLALCDAENMFMLGEELKTCMQIDRQCGRENMALLGYTTQGLARMLRISADEAEVRTAANRGDSTVVIVDTRAGDKSSRTAARAIVRLLGRADTGAPVLWVDQPLFGRDEGTDTDAWWLLLLEKADKLAQTLGGVPVVSYMGSVLPRASSFQDRVALVEFDGTAAH